MQPKKPKTTANFKFGTGFSGFFRVFFFRFFSVFLDFSILAKFDWFNGFLLVIIAFIRHLQGFIGIKCVIRHFLASQDLIVDMIFEWLEFLVEVQTEKTEKVPQKTEKKPKKYRKYRKKNERYRKFQIWDCFFCFIFGFFGFQPPLF